MSVCEKAGCVSTVESTARAGNGGATVGGFSMKDFLWIDHMDQAI